MKDDGQVFLKGDAIDQGIKMISANNLRKYLNKASHGVVAQLFIANIEAKQHMIDGVIQKVLKRFEVLFSEPKGLPPKKGVGHEIKLKPGTQPIFQRAYRYSHA